MGRVLGNQLQKSFTKLAITAVAAALLTGSTARPDTPDELPPDLASRGTGNDWAAFLGPTRNGKSTEVGLNFDWPPGGPPIVWTAPLGASYSAPAVSRGRLFHFDRYGDEDRLICRQAETGEELWSAASRTGYRDLLGYNNGPRCSPVVDGPRVCTFSAEGLLQCRRVTTGALIWEIDTTERFGVVKNFFGVGSTPVVHGDRLIVNVGGSPPNGPPDVYAANGRVAGNGTGVIGFDKRTGKIVWTASDELASYASLVTATIDGRDWCFVFARGGLVALDPQTGKVDFEYPWRAAKLESVNASTPVVVRNELFLSETYGPGSSLLRVRPGGYDVVWKDAQRSRQKAMLLHWNTPIPHEGYLYGSSGRHSNTAELRCIEWATGKVQWSEPGLGRCSLLYADGRLIVLSETGRLLVVKATPQGYQQEQSLMLRDNQGVPLLKPKAWTAPVLAHGLLYVRGDDRLVCLDLATR